MMIDIERRQNQFEHDQILTVKIRDLIIVSSKMYTARG